MLLYITEVDISKDNGPGINEREFVTALLDQASDVACIAPSPSKPGQHFDRRIQYVPVPDGPQWFRGLAFARGVVGRAKSLNHLHGIDGIGIRIGALPILPSWLSYAIGAPIFLKTLAGYGIFGADAERRFRVVAPVLKPFYRRAIREAALADTVSRAYVPWLSETFDVAIEKLELIPNGANTDTFTPGERDAARKALSLDQFDRIVGYVGALHGWRDLGTLIEAFARAELPNGAALVLVGDGPSRPELEARIANLGMAGRVVLTGHVPYALVPTYMRALDVAVALTVIEMQLRGRREVGSFSQKIPQYLACGLPVITWSVPDTVFLDEEGIGRTVEHADMPALAKALGRLIGCDEQQRVEMGHRARSYAVERLSSKVLARQRLDLWRRSLDHA